jgi:hypothetical protein
MINALKLCTVFAVGGIAVGLGTAAPAASADLDRRYGYVEERPVYGYVPVAEPRPVYGYVAVADDDYDEVVVERRTVVAERPAYGYVAPPPPRTYGYVAVAPRPAYRVVERRTYGYVAARPRVYGYAATPARRVYGYRPVYGTETVVLRRPNRAFGLYSPHMSDRPGRVKRFFRTIARQQGN